MRKSRYLMVAVLLLSCCTWISAQTIRFVNQAATGQNDGKTWPDAFTDLQMAINTAQNGDLIFVKAGVYQPAIGTSFSMKEGVRIYGGFSGTEQTLSDRVLMESSASILQGNDNRVMDCENLTAAALLDGFTITGGHSSRDGGGINNISSAAGFSNLLIQGNTADNGGGGVLNQASSSVYTQVIFKNNTAQQYGGGMANIGSDVSLLHSYFVGNTCAQSNGGAMGNYDCSPTITNAVFYNNTAAVSGGAVFNNNAHTRIINASFMANDVQTLGPAIANYGSTAITVFNSIFYANTIQNVIQAGIYNDVIGSVYSFSLLQEAQVGKANIVNLQNPFVNTASPLGADGRFGTLDDGLRLVAGAVAIDKGRNDVSSASTDMTGAARIYHGTIDMGAYEYYPDLPSAGTVAYVNASAAGGDGSTWQQAFKSLGEALTAASANAAIQQIWVASGTYQTQSGQSYAMIEGVKIYGGFTGTEIYTSQRDLHSNNTSILKGNNSRIFLNNSNHLTAAAVLDGFTLTAGVVGAGQYGGAMQNYQSSPTLSNLVFTANSAARGAAIYNSNSSPRILNVTFEGNSVSTNGGAVYNNADANPLFMNVNFVNNSAGNGGAVYNENSSPQIINATFYNNMATAGNGGAIYNLNAASKPIITNTVFWNNSASQGNDLYNNAGSALVTFSYTQTAITGEGNFTGASDPIISPSNLKGPDGIWNTADDGLRLKQGTEAIDRGSNEAIPLWIIGDMTQNSRIVHTTVDMGAYEYRFGQPGAGGIVYVNGSIGTSGDGSSWAAPLSSLGDALATATVHPDVQQIWVANGTYQPREGRGFGLVDGVKVYGGFTGNETSIGKRSLARAATTILKGFNGRVFNNSNVSPSAVLDGFTLTEGRGYLTPDGGQTGAGMNNEYSSPTLSNLVISNNKTLNSSGGGMANLHSSPSLTNVVFVGNQCSAGGAGMINGSASSPTLKNVIFINNTCIAATLDNRGGAMGNYQSSMPVLINVSFISNRGGAIENGQSSTSYITNSLFYNNAVSDINNHDGITNIFAFAEVNNSYLTMSGGCSGSNNLSNPTDPFVDISNPAGADGIWGTEDDGLRLKSGAPVIDAGDNAINDLSAITKDIVGGVRIANRVADMGPYEFQNYSLPVTVTGFRATADAQRIKLQWMATTEVNNKAFILSRSKDGKSFTHIAQMAGRGTTSTPKDYVYFDEHPLNGVNIYRLEQLDNNGRQQQLGVRSANIVLTLNDQIKVFPNPVRNWINIQFMAGKFQLIELLDISGKVLRQAALSSTDIEAKFDMRRLAGGAYFIRLSGKQQSDTRKVIKL